jgi:hypothetical protein
MNATVRAALFVQNKSKNNFFRTFENEDSYWT